MTFFWILGIGCALCLGIIIGWMCPLSWEDEPTGDMDFTVLSRQDTRTPW